MRKSTRRLTEAAQATLAPDEQLQSTGIGWAAPRRERVPLLFQARRQYWFALTDRRMLVFERQRGGPTAQDLVLGKRYDFFTLDAVKRMRPLFQLRVTGANGNRQVLEFRPGYRGLGAQLASRMTARGAGPSPGARTTSHPEAPRPGSAAGDERDATSAAFWGDS